MNSFSEKVWEALYEIPEGKVTSYKEIAKKLKTKAYRAVGTAVGKNPYAPKCPCHRVINSDGKIGNYSGKGGVKTKIRLLKEEGVSVIDGKIDLKTHFYKC
ncbi:MAG TPA: MGMT family protein [Candidatus Nanoarchaeia archaeon]|nr:MGMT family protein [Candidatus Nanoarchaeia archaeon]